jgi:hypothetical protein
MKGLSGLLTEANIHNLRLFLDRFKNRILEMAAKDVDLTTRLVALETLNKMSLLDLLEDVDSKVVISMLFDSDSKVRGAAAKMIPKIVSEKADTIEESYFPSESLWKIKSLCKVLAESYSSTDGRKDTVDSESDDFTISQEELIKAQEADQKQLLEWFSIDWVPRDLSFGISGVKEAVQSLWSTLPIVQVSVIVNKRNGIRWVNIWCLCLMNVILLR